MALTAAVLMLMLGSLSLVSAQDTTPEATSTSSNEAQAAVATAQSEAKSAVATAQAEAGSIAATAQAGVTGAASPAAAGGPSAVGSNPVGTTLTINGQDGSPQSKVTVNKVINNFKDYDPDFGAPDPGTHYIAIQYTFENVGTKPIKVNPFDIFLLDNNGFVYDNDSVSLTDTAEQQYPELGDNENMAPGNKVSGWLFYTVPDTVQVARVLWQPDSGRLIFLADLTAK